MVTLSKENVPTVSVGEMREVDRLAVEEFGLAILMMMENASRNIADLVAELRGKGGGGVLVVAGKGNNGGDALGALRHLHNMGIKGQVFLSSGVGELTVEARAQIKVLQSIGVKITEVGTDQSFRALERSLAEKPLVLDGLLGYNLKGAPRAPISGVIEAVNCSEAFTVAIDLPSGLEGTEGHTPGLAIKAAATATLALPKKALLSEKVAEQVGELYVVDLSIPKELYQRVGLSVGELFADGKVIKIG